MTRIAVVDKSKCNPRGCGDYLCMRLCPMNRAGKECIVEDFDKKIRIDESICSGCNICKKCPFGAIQIINLPTKLKDTPVHRYAENAFELFRLPIPKKGQLVGLLGANGIGKTTALELLSGKIKPNLNQLAKAPSDSEIIHFFKGSELQSYFTNLFANKIKVSYKPQYIDKVATVFKGTVKAMLSKFGNPKEVKEVSKSLGIDAVLARKVSQLSGGELQKATIAVALLKKADLYFFDEPASYLDVKERVNMAKVLRAKAANNDVLAVEHDLIILDYLTDHVHILFGEKAAYGVVSHPLSSKEGINTYLSGYLRDENIRFRPEPIKFGTGTKKEKIELVESIKWPKMEVKLGDFSLRVDASELAKKQVVGIVGANGIGKTTFVKMLAGLVKPSKGKLAKSVKVSYKPQHIVAEKGHTVRSILGASKLASSQQFRVDVIEPLQLDSLMEKDLITLSGGELQKVAIAVCLSKEADLFLLDEPSTYLDVEQRLMASQAIQKVATDREVAVLIVDHDLMFVNHISDKVMVFSGVPAKKGVAKSICSVEIGMNDFLKELGITCRKDPETGRPRVNKAGSVKDKEQKRKGKYYL